MVPQKQILDFMQLENFYSGKRVFLTGHTGFKGAWMSLWLNKMGAKVAGFALEADQESLFNLAEVEKILEKSIIGDIRNSGEIFLSRRFREMLPVRKIHC